MMADLEFDEFEGDFGAPTYDARGFTLRADRAKRLVNLTGAVCSVALVLGVGIWGYQLAVRDVSGVPVMRAMAGPMRVAPADPGGDQASNQGLSVNAVAATGMSGPVADELTLAPRGVELQPGDVSGANDVVALDAAPAAITVSGDAVPASLQITEPAPLGDGGGQLVDADTGATVDVTTALADVEPADPEALVKRSLRPHARPAAMMASAGKPAAKPENVQTVSAPAAASEVDPATLASGTRLAQLGAFDTPELARTRFGELQTQFGELMVGKAIVIQSAQSGGRTFYRLRAHGFEGDDDARRFCAALEAEDVDCIPVAQR